MSSLLKRIHCAALLLMAVFAPKQSFGQNAVAIAVGNTYAFTVPTVVARHNLTTHTTDTTQRQIALENYRFTIVEERGSSYIIRFPQWQGGDTASVSLNKRFVRQTSPGAAIGGGGSASSLLFFSVLKQDLEKKVYRIFPRFGRPEVASGTVIIPVKMRFSEFDFSRDFALGFTVGPRWRISERREHYFHLLGAFNVNIVSVDSASTEGRVKTPTDKGALGLAVGGVFDFNGPQVGLFIGKDWLGRRDKSNWVYQGETWVSLGMGFTIFSRANNSATSQDVENKSKPK
ncbi:hypothetical protein [Hymenobacter guriensis]|uniref:Outer membrane protein beta-barrel domain-containing protein n=1 Tax=Hymenobacter guriensis TaxID=2793065 RepID=A0ABS0L2N2_9BACT|nr:hypothetical protein [Hymenobacter guriensis]MBG8554378.1 hypothetical protein [Hymenobacter guriensis]